MAARDIYHTVVVEALEKDGWTVERDPFTITFLNRTMLVDLKVEGLSVFAEQANGRIAIEIKSFLNNSPIKDFQEAIGQYVMYKHVLGETDPDCKLWLAVPESVYSKFFQEDFARFILEKVPINLVIFDERTASISQWKPSANIAGPSKP